MRLKMFLYVIIACCWGKTSSIPQHILNEFKSNLLPLFGMKDRPKLDGQKPQVPESLRKLYEVQNNLEYDTSNLPLPGLLTKSANTVRSFVHVASPIDEKFITHNKFRLKFDVSSIPKNERLKAAQIQLSRESLDLSSSPVHRLLVHDILRRGIKDVRAPIMRVIDSQLIDLRKNNTISIDVFPAVERWIADPKSNHGVLVVLHSPSEKPHLRLRRSADPNWAQSQPFLFTYTDDGKNKQRSAAEMTKMRPKRVVRPNNKRNPKDPCKRRPMYVDFRDVGWSDWIVAPLGYDAYYCSGECDFPLADHLNTTNHAIVQSILSSVKPMEVPKPCCVPTELSAISMLYVGNDQNVILKNYKQMVVEGCGCR